MARKLRSDLRASSLFGVAVIAIFLGGGIVWAVRAPLSGAVIANGVIGFEGSRKTVQHLEGGIIKEILVTEGDIVTAGSTQPTPSTTVRGTILSLCSSIMCFHCLPADVGHDVRKHVDRAHNIGRIGRFEVLKRKSRTRCGDDAHRGG